MAYVLVVEDDATTRVVLQRILEDEGHDVRFAPDGERALAICEGGGIDLVITDLVMPKLNGWNLLRELRARMPRVSAVVLSASHEAERASELGARSVLHKPVGRGALLEAVETALKDRDVLPTDNPWEHVRF